MPSCRQALLEIVRHVAERREDLDALQFPRLVVGHHLEGRGPRLARRQGLRPLPGTVIRGRGLAVARHQPLPLQLERLDDEVVLLAICLSSKPSSSAWRADALRRVRAVDRSGRLGSFFVLIPARAGEPSAGGMPRAAAAPCNPLASSEAELDRQDSGAIGRAETKAARQAERSEAAAVVWAELEQQRREVDDRTARLRALRLARDAAGAD